MGILDIKKGAQSATLKKMLGEIEHLKKDIKEPFPILRFSKPQMTGKAASVEAVELVESLAELTLEEKSRSAFKAKL